MTKQITIINATQRNATQRANCALFAYTSKYRYSEPFDDGTLLSRPLPSGFSCFQGRCFV